MMLSFVIGTVTIQYRCTFLKEVLTNNNFTLSKLMDPHCHLLKGLKIACQIPFTLYGTVFNTCEFCSPSSTDKMLSFI